MHRRLTYPCVVGHRIVELTAEEREALQWRQLPIEDKVEALLARVAALEKRLSNACLASPPSLPQP